ncbi:ejaculatory bulb-specific protein 3-like [Condylostylus longicornis]|uniref:ejaculatory bulb-specific protein 3-like n=1 Tax=Condylostylus longicornis TaxID=2530218 RepID=UPI00244DD599|nr:ejaculatory bulb-specific protein 3-like [Condylostylus longicornis]XP_055379987.1 ejaculatory bulb-specific protein 3-like [Condylostylus longicornis]
MKFSLFIAVILCFAGVIAAQTYTNRFDTVDVDAILSNQRILNNYIKCILEKGPCTAEGRELKKLLPDALATDCSKCTQTQRSNSDKVISHLKAQKPNEFKQILKKYDPEGRSQLSRSLNK